MRKFIIMLAMLAAALAAPQVSEAAPLANSAPPQAFARLTPAQFYDRGVANPYRPEFNHSFRRQERHEAWRRRAEWRHERQLSREYEWRRREAWRHYNPYRNHW